jgi:cell shape-determining protein MreC
MGYENSTKKELIEIIEGQLNDIKELEAENDELWKLLEDIKESESITFAVLDTTKPLTPEVIAGFYDPIDE